MWLEYQTYFPAKIVTRFVEYNPILLLQNGKKPETISRLDLCPGVAERFSYQICKVQVISGGLLLWPMHSRERNPVNNYGCSKNIRIVLRSTPLRLNVVKTQLRKHGMGKPNTELEEAFLQKDSFISGLAFCSCT